MVAPGMLENPRVKNWLGGVEPAWPLLDYASYSALVLQPTPGEGPVRLASDLTDDESRRSAVARNASILLRAASGGEGLALTATGNLTRSVVAEMRDLLDWPDFDSEGAFSFHKVVNEPDFFPLFFVRHVVQASGLLRRRKGLLRTSASGRKMLEDGKSGALQAALFQNAWRLDLGLGRGLHPGWPLRDLGIVLWSLSVGANAWDTPERLTRLCTVPIIGVLEAEWDSGAMAMESRVLRPLLWFGLLEYRREEIEGSRFGARHFYRKSPLFDRMISFEVGLEGLGEVQH